MLAMALDSRLRGNDDGCGGLVRVPSLHAAGSDPAQPSHPRRRVPSDRIPAYAGMTEAVGYCWRWPWIPAYAGMTAAVMDWCWRWPGIPVCAGMTTEWWAGAGDGPGFPSARE